MPEDHRKQHRVERNARAQTDQVEQLTHGAYERLRTRQADKFEELVLEAFQKKVTGEVPVPPGADGIPDYPERGADAR